MIETLLHLKDSADRYYVCNYVTHSTQRWCHVLFNDGFAFDGVCTVRLVMSIGNWMKYRIFLVPNYVASLIITQSALDLHLGYSTTVVFQMRKVVQCLWGSLTVVSGTLLTIQPLARVSNAHFNAWRDLSASRGVLKCRQTQFCMTVCKIVWVPTSLLSTGSSSTSV